MGILEAVVERGAMAMERTFKEARNDVAGMWRANKAGILAGFAYGAAGRLFLKGHASALPAILTPLVTYARKYSWLNRLDSVGISAGGYVAGYVLTELALRAVFNEFAQQLPTTPPQPSFPASPVQPHPPGIFLV